MTSSALPGADGVPLRWSAGQVEVVVPWSATPAKLTHLLDGRSGQRQEDWITVGGVRPFSDTERDLTVGFAFREGALSTVYFTIPSREWSPSSWVIEELAARYGPPHEPPSDADEYEVYRWRLPTFTIAHGLFGIYAGPAEAAEERIEFRPVAHAARY